MDEEISAVLFEGSEMEGCLITKWVVVAEFVKPDGNRALGRNWSESCAPWDVDMLLAAGQSQEWEDDDEAE